MQKFIAFLSIGLMVASTASAEVDAQAFKAVSDIQRGVNNNNQIKTLRVAGDAAIGGDMTLGGGLALNGSRMAITSNLVATAGAVTATMTNAPALVSAAAPKWVVVEIDGTDYVVPAFKLQP
jgi:hypothetical protein